MARAALVQSPAWGVECPPYGLAVLKAYLQNAGHHVRAHDMNLRLYLAAGDRLKPYWEPDRHQFWLDERAVRAALAGELAAAAAAAVDDILGDEPRVVGFTAVFSNQAAALVLAAEVKRRSPRTLVVFGGPQASVRAGARAILASGAADFCVEGEGEVAFAKLLESLDRGADAAAAPGLTFLRDGGLRQTPPPPRVADLASLPFADYSDFPMESYRTPGTVPVSLSRGCPNQCVFCYEVEYWERFRVRKAKSLVDEIAFHLLTLPKVWHLWFHDSLINGNIGELRRFAQGLVDLNLPRLTWSSQAVIRKEMTRELLELLKASGCICLNYGLESASFSVMLKMGKVLAKGADADRIVRDTREAGIDTVLNFMFGFPGETEADFQESLDFVARNKDWITMVQPSPGFCDFYPGTKGYQHPERLGITFDGGAHWESLDGANTYATRLERFERFLDVVHALGVKCSYPHRRLYLRHTILGHYHFNRREWAAALPHLEEASRSEPASALVEERLADCRARA